MTLALDQRYQTTQKISISFKRREKKNDPTKEKRGGERERERGRERLRNGSTRGRGLVHSSKMQATAELYSHDAWHVLCMNQNFILYKLNLSPTSTSSKETRKTKEESLKLLFPLHWKCQAWVAWPSETQFPTLKLIAPMEESSFMTSSVIAGPSSSLTRVGTSYQSISVCKSKGP